MENIYVIIDTSSSMKVLSKRSILKNIYSFILGVSNNLEYENFDFIFYLWQSNGINECFKDDMGNIEFNAKTDIKHLIDFINNNDSEKLKLLLLTDGYIDTSLNIIPSVLLKKANISIVNIGIDSDSLFLSNKLKAKSFEAENISQALSYICYQV